MKELLNKVSEKIGDTRDAVMDSLEHAFSIEKLTEKFSSMTDSAREKSANFTSDIISLSPIIEEIGFKTKGITLAIGLPPSATFHFEKFKDIAAERREEILAQHKDNAMLGIIVKTLVAADDYQKKIKLGNFKFECIEVCIGLGPGVNVQLVPKEA
ncbi:MAG: hypothetical protein BGO69_04425 [Bacteroidetes bacterium 46-16]|nr:MAG: hypothetical protein BGO69_04425 [Bacteroidetes bacterium 46-16]